jgi:hypothetical protein
MSCLEGFCHCIGHGEVKKRVLNILNRFVKKVKRKSDRVVFWVCCRLSGFSHAMQA